MKRILTNASSTAIGARAGKRTPSFLRLPRLALLAPVLLAGTCGYALGQDAAVADGPPPGWVGPPPGWSGGVLGGAAQMPDFEGSRTSRTEPVIGFRMSYRSDNLGSVEMGSRGVNWTFVQQPEQSLSVGLSNDPGRVDTGRKTLTPVGYRPGSDRLQGLGDIDITPVLALSGSYTLVGVPLTATLSHAISSHQGTLLDLGLAIPWKITPHAKLSIAPTVTWADGRYMQAFFGVTSVQAAASRYAAFEARSGIKSAQLTVDFDMEFSRHWHLNATVQGKHLLGDAGYSPITEKTTQVSGLLGMLYQFQL